MGSADRLSSARRDARLGCMGAALESSVFKSALCRAQERALAEFSPGHLRPFSLDTVGSGTHTNSLCALLFAASLDPPQGTPRGIRFCWIMCWHVGLPSDDLVKDDLGTVVVAPSHREFCVR